jgi:3-hydroxybutyryl-CoA dehydrogenase
MEENTMKVAVIGAGTMGSGIAQAFAQCDAVEKVYLCDIKQEFADGGKGKIRKQLDRQVTKGKMEQAKEDEILAKVQTGLNSQATDPDLVVEAVLERMDLKKSTFRDLQDNIVKNPDCVFASNTSSLSITEIGNGLAKPVVGMHFFNPAPVMKLVEVISGANTPRETVEKIKEISEAIGKTPVQVNEAAGFVVNRILVPMINEGINVYYTGTSDIEGIDTAMKLGCNHPMGPLELGDYIGLDVVLAIMDVIFNDTHDNKYAASPLLRKMVRAGHLGVKSGRGFYVYNADRTKTPVDQLV